MITRPISELHTTPDPAWGRAFSWLLSIEMRQTLWRTLASVARGLGVDDEQVHPAWPSAGEDIHQYNCDCKWPMVSLSTLIHSDPDILGGAPVFAGTRVPFRALIDYLAGGQPLAEFLEDFPSVTRDKAIAALRMAAQALVNDACSA